MSQDDWEPPDVVQPQPEFVADDQKEGDDEPVPAEPVEPSRGPSIAYLVGIALLLATVAAVID